MDPVEGKTERERRGGIGRGRKWWTSEWDYLRQPQGQLVAWKKGEGEASGHEGWEADEGLELKEIIFQQLHPLLKGMAQGARGKRGKWGRSSRGWGADSE